MPRRRHWTPTEDVLLTNAVEKYGSVRNWLLVARDVPGRSNAQCLQRWTRSLRKGLKKGKWSFTEDQLLTLLTEEAGALSPENLLAQKSANINWPLLAQKIEGRTSKQCRERWFEHLSPAVNTSPYTAEEDTLLLNLYSSLGRSWTRIALDEGLKAGRTADSVKVRIRTLLKQEKDSQQIADCEQRKKRPRPDRHSTAFGGCEGCEDNTRGWLESAEGACSQSELNAKRLKIDASVNSILALLASADFDASLCQDIEMDLRSLDVNVDLLLL